MYNQNDSINIAYNYIQGLRSSGHTYNGYGVYNVTKDDLKALFDISDKYGIPGEWMVNLMNFESGRTFNPAIQNSIGATGTIQFMPSTARGLGTTTDALKKMTFKQQLSYVDRYLYDNLRSHLTINGKIPSNFTQADLYMTIFYPAAIGRPDYVFPASVQSANAGIAKPSDYANKALAVAVFPLSMIPYSLAEFNKKYGNVVTYVKRNWLVLLIGIILLIIAILLFAFRKQEAAYIAAA